MSSERDFLARQALPGSRNTVLRRVRSLPTPAYPPPHVVGIDDWAWRKGHRYGTIVVDLERGCPIDVLEDRFHFMMASGNEFSISNRAPARAFARAKSTQNARWEGFAVRSEAIPGPGRAQNLGDLLR